MRTSTIRSLATALATSALLLPAAAGLSEEGCNPKALGLPEPDGGTDYTEIPDVVTALGIMPPTANVLTCDSVPLSSEAVLGSWSVDGGGTISASLGVTSTHGVTYTGPNVVPTPPTVTVSEVAGTSRGSATLTLATAFVGTADSLPIAGNDSLGEAFYPLTHTFAASGSQVYAGISGPIMNVSGGQLVDVMQVYASSNSGASFTKTDSYSTGDLFCGALAVDAGDPSVVYLTYAAGHGDSTTNTGGTVRLAVSTDGGKTFPLVYVVADTGAGNPSWIGCADVVSPSASHVIVSNAFDPGGEYWVATFVSGNRGASIGETSADYGDAGASGSGYVSPSDTNSGAQSINGINGDAQLSPLLFTNGKGGACTVYVEAGSSAVMVQCSSNNGTTWSAPASVAGSTASNSVATGAMSAAGNIAIAYQQSASNGGNNTFVVISEDGGHSWKSPVKYPLPSWAAGAQQTEEAFLAWESDSILWLSETVIPASDPTNIALLVDKTCDFGHTWSGSVNAGSYAAGGLVQTSTGMVAGGYIPSNAPTGPALALLPLAP